MFVFFAAAGIVQSAIDALPPQTLDARSDLRQLYARIELAKATLTHVGPTPPGWRPVDGTSTPKPPLDQASRGYPFGWNGTSRDGPPSSCNAEPMKKE
jgi:hypothetical protein